MVADVSRYWWIFLIRGVAAIAFGILAWVWPGLTIALLVALFGAYALVDGIFSIAGALRGGRTSRWLPLLIGGVAGIALGLVTWIWPGLTATTVLYLIAAWAASPRSWRRSGSDA